MATTVTETARVTGAVNTLVRRHDGGWDAHNTDVRGIEAALADIDHGGAATLLGGGRHGALRRHRPRCPGGGADPARGAR